MTWRTLTKAEFDAWHQQYLADNGYPLPGRNAATGELVPAPTGVTAAYTNALEVASADCRFTVLMPDDDPDLPGDPAADPSWFFDTSLETLWVDADRWALVDDESKAAFMAFPDEAGALGEPRDVVRDDIDYVVWAAASITEDHLLALAEVLP